MREREKERLLYEKKGTMKGMEKLRDSLSLIQIFSTAFLLQRAADKAFLTIDFAKFLSLFPLKESYNFRSCVVISQLYIFVDLAKPEHHLCLWNGVV